MLNLDKEVDIFGWMTSIVEAVRNLLQSVPSEDLEITIAVIRKMLVLDVTNVQNFILKILKIFCLQVSIDIILKLKIFLWKLRLR